MAHVLVLQGPNLNLLGVREPTLYGVQTLEAIHLSIKSRCTELGHVIETFQSNSEQGLIERIQKTLSDLTDFIIFNPAGYTHTSVALRDALLAVKKPFIEVHLSNIHAREPFRSHSYFSDIAIGTISGLGAQGYLCALDAAHHYLTEQQRGQDGYPKS